MIDVLACQAEFPPDREDRKQLHREGDHVSNGI